MRFIRETLEDMKVRLENVETTLTTLNAHVAESNGRQEDALEKMRAHAEQMRAHAEQMRLDVARNTAAFDQAVTGSVENLEKYRHGMAIIIEYLTKRVTRSDKKRKSLEMRVKAIEDRLAG